MTDLEIVRVVIEVLTLAASFIGGVYYNVRKVAHVLAAVERVEMSIGAESDPRAGTLRAELARHDSAQNALSDKVEAHYTEAVNARSVIAQRLARIEGKLGLPEEIST